MYSFLYQHLISRLPDKWVERLGGSFFKLSTMIESKMIELPVTIAGIEFPNPMGMPAGWIDTPSKLKTAHRLGVGIPTIKTITYHGKKGNPYPRIIRDEATMINSLGLPNKGLQWWIDHYNKPDYPTIISIKGNTPKEWIELITGLEKKTEILELNLSCPNIGDGILDIPATKTLIEDITGVTSTPIFLKLSPEYSPKENVKLIASIRDQISGITAINTRPVINSSLGNPTHQGGLSGPAIHSQLIDFLFGFRQEFPTMTDLPILATGGITSGTEAWEIIEQYKSIPMGLTGFLTQGPGYYQKMVRFVLKQLTTRDVLLTQLLE